ncbi:MAG: hypothetical protein JO142_09145 [Burkholderiales bacterium]|nr:hypothetical protein [Burkholderiales bacterium]
MPIHFSQERLFNWESGRRPDYAVDAAFWAQSALTNTIRILINPLGNRVRGKDAAAIKASAGIATLKFTAMI